MATLSGGSALATGIVFGAKGYGEDLERTLHTMKSGSMVSIEEMYQNGEISQEEYNNIKHIKGLSESEYQEYYDRLKLQYQNSSVLTKEGLAEQQQALAQMKYVEQIRSYSEGDWKTSKNYNTAVTHATAVGVWEGIQGYVGAKGFAIKGHTMLTSAAKVTGDTVFNATDTFYRAGIDVLTGLENNYGEAFEKQGGRDAVIASTVIGLIGSTYGEIKSHQKLNSLAKAIDDGHILDNLDDNAAKSLKDTILYAQQSEKINLIGKKNSVDVTGLNFVGASLQLGGLDSMTNKQLNNIFTSSEKILAAQRKGIINLNELDDRHKYGLESLTKSDNFASLKNKDMINLITGNDLNKFKIVDADYANWSEAKRVYLEEFNQKRDWFQERGITQENIEEKFGKCLVSRDEDYFSMYKTYHGIPEDWTAWHNSSNGYTFMPDDLSAKDICHEITHGLGYLGGKDGVYRSFNEASTEYIAVGFDVAEVKTTVKYSGNVVLLAELQDELDKSGYKDIIKQKYYDRDLAGLKTIIDDVKGEGFFDELNKKFIQNEIDYVEAYRNNDWINYNVKAKEISDFIRNPDLTLNKSNVGNVLDNIDGDIEVAASSILSRKVKTLDEVIELTLQRNNMEITPENMEYVRNQIINGEYGFVTRDYGARDLAEQYYKSIEHKKGINRRMDLKNRMLDPKTTYEEYLELWHKLKSDYEAGGFDFNELRPMSKEQFQNSRKVRTPRNEYNPAGDLDGVSKARKKVKNIDDVIELTLQRNNVEITPENIENVRNKIMNGEYSFVTRDYGARDLAEEYYKIMEYEKGINRRMDLKNRMLDPKTTYEEYLELWHKLKSDYEAGEFDFNELRPMSKEQFQNSREVIKRNTGSEISGNLKATSTHKSDIEINTIDEVINLTLQRNDMEITPENIEYVRNEIKKGKYDFVTRDYGARDLAEQYYVETSKARKKVEFEPAGYLDGTSKARKKVEFEPAGELDGTSKAGRYFEPTGDLDETSKAGRYFEPTGDLDEGSGTSAKTKATGVSEGKSETTSGAKTKSNTNTMEGLSVEEKIATKRQKMYGHDGPSRTLSEWCTMRTLDKTDAGIKGREGAIVKVENLDDLPNTFLDDLEIFEDGKIGLEVQDNKGNTYNYNDIKAYAESRKNGGSGTSARTKATEDLDEGNVAKKIHFKPAGDLDETSKTGRYFKPAGDLDETSKTGRYFEPAGDLDGTSKARKKVEFEPAGDLDETSKAGRYFEPAGDLDETSKARKKVEFEPAGELDETSKAGEKIKFAENLDTGLFKNVDESMIEITKARLIQKQLNGEIDFSKMSRDEMTKHIQAEAIDIKKQLKEIIDDSEFNKKNLTEGIVEKIPKELDELARARMAYLKLNQSVVYSDKYFAMNQAMENADQFYSILKTQQDYSEALSEIYNMPTDITNLSTNSIVCSNWAELYAKLMEELGIDRSRIKVMIETGEDAVNPHRYVQIELQDGRLLVADAAGVFNGRTDIVNAKFKNETGGFIVTTQEDFNYYLEDNNGIVGYAIDDARFKSLTTLRKVDELIGYSSEETKKKMEKIWEFYGDNNDMSVSLDERIEAFKEFLEEHQLSSLETYVVSRQNANKFFEGYTKSTVYYRGDEVISVTEIWVDDKMKKYLYKINDSEIKLTNEIQSIIEGAVNNNDIK